MCDITEILKDGFIHLDDCMCFSRPLHWISNPCWNKTGSAHYPLWLDLQKGEADKSQEYVAYHSGDFRPSASSESLPFAETRASKQNGEEKLLNCDAGTAKQQAGQATRSAQHTSELGVATTYGTN